MPNPVEKAKEAVATGSYVREDGTEDLLLVYDLGGEGEETVIRIAAAYVDVARILAPGLSIPAGV